MTDWKAAFDEACGEIKMLHAQPCHCKFCYDDGCVDILVDGKPERTVMPATPSAEQLREMGLKFNAVTCPHCRGSGTSGTLYEDGSDRPCQGCEGKGHLRVDYGFSAGGKP
jgi:DnaJ-class molecular chaperone